jgi:hypothetical protein
MDVERGSLLGDLTDAVRPEGNPSRILLSQQLDEIEAEHRALCERRRRLHESIDLLTGLDVIKPDAAARLERYQTTEKTVSRRRAELYVRIRELQSEQPLQTERR